MKAVLIACLLLIPMWVFGQSVDDRLQEIEAALSEENTPLAAALFERYTRDYISDQDYLSLSYFIPRSGFIAHRRDNVDAGMESVRHWLEYIQSQTNDPRVLRQAHLESHTFYIFAGKYQMAYDANKTALDYTFKIPDYAPSEWALIESNLGVIANYLGKSDLARSHTLKAKKGLDEDPNTSPVNRFNVLNDLGASYWYTAQYDSAEYFWKEAMAFLEQMESNPTNRYYRRAMIEGNLAALYDIQGKLEESAKLVKSSIAHNRYFIDTALDDPKRNRAFASIFYSSMNLGLVYKSMGNYKQALQIHEYALREKEKHFPPGHPEIAESLISVAQAHKSLMNFPKAKDYLHRAKDAIISADGGYYMQLADIHYTLGLLHDREGNPAEAKKQYLKAQSFFEKANKG